MRHTWLAFVPSLLFTMACGGDDAPTFQNTGAGGTGGSTAVGGSSAGGSSAGGSSAASSSAGGSSSGSSAGGSSAGGSSAGGSDSGGSSAGGSSAGGSSAGGSDSGGSAGEAGETSTGGTSGCVDTDDDGACAADDCDDDDDDVYPGATEVPCNGKDDDCDAGTPDMVDLDADSVCSADDCDDSVATGASCSEGCVTALDDNDGDHFGDLATAHQVCALPAGTVEDLDGAVDCDDEDATLIPLDLDGDGVTSCDGDCNDADPSIAPGLSDACPMGVNNDCDDAMDEDAEDSDGDGAPDCIDACPMVPETPTSITWRWQTAGYGSSSCYCTDTFDTFDSTGWEFFVNGVSQGTGEQLAIPSCECLTPEGEVTHPFTGTWNPVGEDNVLTFTKENNDVGEIMGWVQAVIDYNGQGSETICLTGTCPGTPGYYYGACSLDCGPIGDVCFDECDPEVMTVSHSGDLDGDSTPSACDCSDDPSIDSNAAARSSRNSELCDDGIDNDCDTFIDSNDDIANSTNDSECESCERTSATEVSCDDEVDDDCDGLTDQDDPDCAGSVCGHPSELYGLALGSARDSQSGTLDLCAAGADASSTDVCETTLAQSDYWQEVTVHDPAGTGYRLQVCFDNAPGEIILSTDLSCGDDAELACVGAFQTSSENCATYPDAGDDPFFGTASYQLVYRGDEGGCPEYAWSVTVVEP